MYNMGTLLRNGSKAQKDKYLPSIAAGKLRIQSMAVTEPTTGTDTTKIKTTALKKGDRYVVNGQKVWISRVQHSDLMILLARTTPLADVKKKSEGMSIFIVDLHQAIGKGLEVRPIPNLVNHETNELFFDNLEIPAENLIGEEGKGFKYILDGLNAERTLIAAECIGDGYWFIDRATKYANERIVFDRPIGKNQGVQFPIADAFIEVEAANLMRFEAARRYDAHQPCGAQANMAKYLAAKASLGSGQRVHADARRLRLRQRIRHRAQVPRDAAVPGGADLDQPDLRLRGRAHPRPAAGAFEMTALGRHHRRHAGTRHRRALLHAPARRPGCARHQGRAPGSGDFARAYDERVKGMASHFVWSNRSKESLTLDVKHAQTRRRCWRSCWKAPTCWCRTWRPAPRRAGPVVRRAARQAPEADRLRHLRLRR